MRVGDNLTGVCRTEPDCYGGVTPRCLRDTVIEDIPWTPGSPYWPIFSQFSKNHSSAAPSNFLSSRACQLLREAGVTRQGVLEALRGMPAVLRRQHSRWIEPIRLELGGRGGSVRADR